MKSEKIIGIVEFEERSKLNRKTISTWTTQGYLKITSGGGKAGIRRKWLESEIEVAIRMNHFVNAGFNLEAAEILARHNSITVSITTRMLHKIIDKERVKRAAELKKIEKKEDEILQDQIGVDVKE